MAAALLLLAGAAHAQLTVDLQIKRRVFLLHEPILATVVVSNLSGHDVVLAETAEGGQWFSFHITEESGRMVPPRDANYEVEPLHLKAGETMKRTVNLNSLFPLGDKGGYRLKASIFFPEIGKYFASRMDHFTVLEGKLLSKQTVGVPEGQEGAGGYRDISILTMEQDKGKMLYVRIEGHDNIVYGCYNLGRIVEGIAPDVKFDSGNNMAILQLIGPKTYTLSRVGVNGNFLGQATYVTPKSQPFLRRTADGALQIVGAVRQEVAQTNPLAPGSNVPKVSDRPPGF